MPQRPVCLNRETKLWAFLAYLAADNNLSDAGLDDIQEMCDVGASRYTHVGLEIDTHGELDGSIRYEISEPDWLGHAHRVVVERLGERDSGSPEALYSFAKWALHRFHARNYVGVMWNHGSGFRNPRRDIGYDDFGSSLDMPELSYALRRAGVKSKSKLAILGFDACLMNMLEVVNHFDGQAHIVVGSQQTEPFDGWPYDRILKLLKKPLSRQRLAKGIVEEYIKDYRRRGQRNVTQSAIDVPRTQRVVYTLNRLGAYLAANFSSYEATLRRLRMDAQTFRMADYIDLIHMAKLIDARIANSAISNAAADVVRATKACIIANGWYGSGVSNANGLSIWFPSTRNLYVQYRAKYLALKCNTSRSGWVRFLDRYHR